MSSNWFRRLLNVRSGSNRGGRRATARRPLGMEGLEGRLAMAVFTWTGANSELWSDPGNWGENVAPTAVDEFLDDELFFPDGGVVNFTTINDIGLVSTSQIHIEGDNYDISGGTIRLNTNAPGFPGLLVQGSNNVLRSDLDLQDTIQEMAFEVVGSRSFTLSSLITGPGGFRKQGEGTLILDQDSDYTGATIVDRGILEVRADGALGDDSVATTVNSPGTLRLGPGSAGGTEPLTLRGSGGTTNRGALNVDNVNTSWDGQITLGSAATVVRVDGGILSPVTLNGRVRGGGNGLTKVGNGRLHLAGNSSNDYTGTTRVNQGVLLLAKAAGVNAISGPLVVGDLAVVRLFADDQIADTRAITVEGTLDLDGQDETVGPITFNTGTILPDGGTLTMNGNVTTFGANNAIGGGTLDLNGLTRTFTVANGASLIDLNVSANIVGTGAGVTKNGAGKLRFTGTNTYTGQTLIQAGALEVDGDQPWSPIVVESLGTLEGDGRVGATEVRGTVRPGRNSDSLTINSVVTFVPSMNTIFAVDLHRDVKTAGKLIARTATISGTNLVISDNVNDLPPIGSPVIIMVAQGGLSGRFKGLPNNSTLVSSSGVTYRVNYTSTLVYVTRVTGP